MLGRSLKLIAFSGRHRFQFQPVVIDVIDGGQRHDVPARSARSAADQSPLLAQVVGRPGNRSVAPAAVNRAELRCPTWIGTMRPAIVREERILNNLPGAKVDPGGIAPSGKVRLEVIAKVVMMTPRPDK